MNNRKFATITICFASLSIFSYAQNGKTTGVYREKIAVHTNTDFLLTGEILYYSIYCLEDGSSRFSTLSKLAYVELIGENENPLLQTKVALLEGRGAGDFFLPSTLPSGNYTLIVYTKWMRNFPLEDFFQKQITIVNPYRKPFSNDTQANIEENKTAIRSINLSNSRIGHLQVSAEKKKYTPRQKVVVVMTNSDPLYDCEISLSVHGYDQKDAATSGSRKVDSLKNSARQSASRSNEMPITVIPDFRGETITGLIKDNVSHQPIANTTVYLSASGPVYDFQISKTDSLGRFYFSSKHLHGQKGIQFQIDRASESPFDVILDDEFVNDYGEFKPLPFSIDTTVRRRIEQRNVYSQLENAYYATKRDSILALTQTPFFGKPDKVFNLDDFTRFPSMEDIFKEYMYDVVVSKRDKKFVLQLINTRNGQRFINTPLMLIDGILVSDTEILMNYNPLLIKRVSLVTRQYVYGGILYDGILSIDTYDGQAKDLPVVTIKRDYTGWQRSKKYYSPLYNGDDRLQRIPDYRVQLFWNPTIQIKAGQTYTVEFYTSDVVGSFLIEAIGFDSNGAPVNIHQTIEVAK